MRYLLPCLLLALVGCETNPVLTTVVSAPVRIACTTATPSRPKMLTPCAPDAAFDKCFQDYEIDTAVLLGHVTKLEGVIRSCR